MYDVKKLRNLKQGLSCIRRQGQLAFGVQRWEMGTYRVRIERASSLLRLSE